MNRYLRVGMIVTFLLLIVFRIGAQERIALTRSAGASPRIMKFELRAEHEAESIWIAWGGDEEKEYRIDNKPTLVESERPIAGETIRIRGHLVGLSLTDDNLSRVDLTAASALKYLSLDNVGLTSIDLRKNVSLEEVDLNSNSFTTADFSSCPQLRSLTMAACGLSVLNLSANACLELLDVRFNDLEEISLHPEARLRYLKCNNNKLESLNLDGQEKLQTLDCSQNRFSSLDFRGLIALEYLNTEFNKTLRALHLPKAPQLSYFNCSECCISVLDLSGLSAAKIINCGGNRLSSLDVSANTQLERLYCSANQLESLDLQGNQRLNELFLANNSFTAETLNTVYKALPRLSSKPENPNLFNGGSNSAEGSKTYLAEQKNWYPAVSGNGGSGKNCIVLQQNSPGKASFALEALSPESKVYVDCGNGIDHPIELVDGRADLQIDALGTIVVSGAFRAFSSDNSLLAKANASGATMLQRLRLVGCGLKELLLADHLPLSRLELQDNECTFLDLKMLPLLTYVNIDNNKMSAKTLDKFFGALPRLIDPVNQANLFFDSNPGTASASIEIARERGWVVGGTADSRTVKRAQSCIRLQGNLLIITSPEAGALAIYDLNGRLCRWAPIGSGYNEVPLTDVDNPTLVVHLIYHSGTYEICKVSPMN